MNEELEDLFSGEVKCINDDEILRNEALKSMYSIKNKT